MEAVGNQLLTSKACFELFGYDFIVDSDYETWLIEVNTNPCIEQSCPHLEKCLFRMIRNIFFFNKKMICLE